MVLYVFKTLLYYMNQRRFQTFSLLVGGGGKVSSMHRNNVRFIVYQNRFIIKNAQKNLAKIPEGWTDVRTFFWEM